MPTKKEIDSVFSQDANTRFEYSVKRIAGNEEVWFAESSTGFLLMGDADGTEIFPVWPHEEYVKVFCEKGRPNYKPTAIPLDDLIENFIPECIRKKQKIGVLPMPDGEAVVVDIEFFMKALDEELQQYE